MESSDDLMDWISKYEKEDQIGFYDKSFEYFEKNDWEGIRTYLEINGYF